LPKLTANIFQEVPVVNNLLISKPTAFFCTNKKVEGLFQSYAEVSDNSGIKTITLVRLACSEVN
jgi:hypothetical protein